MLYEKLLNQVINTHFPENKFEFEGTDNELMESGEDCDGSAELWSVYERIEKFAEEFNIDWETCEFIDDSGEDWAKD